MTQKILTVKNNKSIDLYGQARTKEIMWNMTSEELEFKMKGRVIWMFWDFKKLKRRKWLENKKGQTKIIWERSQTISSGCLVQ